jgi:hypothetical protein
VQRGVPLRPQQFLLGDPGVLVGDVLGIDYRGRCGRLLGCVQDAQAFAPGGSGQPTRQRGWVAEVVQVVDQVQPDALADIAVVGAS